MEDKLYILLTLILIIYIIYLKVICLIRRHNIKKHEDALCASYDELDYIPFNQIINILEALYKNKPPEVVDYKVKNQEIGGDLY